MAGKQLKTVDLTEDQLLARLDRRQRDLYLSQSRRGRLSEVHINCATEVMTLVTLDGKPHAVNPIRRRAPRLYGLVAALGVAAMVVLACTALPPDFSGFDGPSVALGWATVLGLYVGMLASWPTRRPTHSRLLRALDGASVMIGLYELRKVAERGDRERTARTVD